MKRILLIILLFPSIAFANDWSGQAKVYKTISSDSENIVQSGSGLEVSLKHIKTGLYPYISYDINPVRFGGQRGADINLWGFGLGIEKKVVEGLNLFCQAGWYQPQWEHNAELLPFNNTEHLAEGLWIYLNNKLAPLNRTWDAYSLDYHGNIGGIVGANWILPVTNAIDINLSGSYRYLKLQEMVKGMDYGNTTGWWEYKQDRDFSGFQVGLGIEVRF